MKIRVNVFDVRVFCYKMIFKITYFVCYVCCVYVCECAKQRTNIARIQRQIFRLICNTHCLTLMNQNVHIIFFFTCFQVYYVVSVVRKEHFPLPMLFMLFCAKYSEKKTVGLKKRGRKKMLKVPLFTSTWEVKSWLASNLFTV